MTSCYLCDLEITVENSSVEHIFPNAIGGKLKSRKLLCRDCNTFCGSHIDIAFQLFIPELISQYVIKRESGETPSFTAKTADTGDEVIVSKGLKIAFRDPKIEVTENTVTISAYNKERALQEVKRWIKYHVY